MTSYQEILEMVQQLSTEERDQLRQTLEVLAKNSPEQGPVPKKNRTPGFNRGQIWISADFNDPLPDEYLGIAS